MRTTLTLDDDLLNAARTLASAEGKSLGEVISRLVRRGLRPEPQTVNEAGLPVFHVPPGASPLTSEMVRRAWEEG